MTSPETQAPEKHWPPWTLLLCQRCWHAPIAVKHPWGDTSVSGGLTLRLPQAATDSPCLKQPRLWTPVTPTGGGTPLPSIYDAPCTNARRESGRARTPVQPASCHVHSARGGSLPCRGASHDERERLATDLDVACKITCTALHYDDSHLSCWSSYFATEKPEPLLRPASCPRDCRRRRLAWLPPQVLHLGRHAQASNFAHPSA
jgi:hypothetical protein